MLSAADNELLTRTDKGTPGGEYFRRFWIGAALRGGAGADCPPVRVKLMGECLVAFRDTAAASGWSARIARTARSISFGRNEHTAALPLHGWNTTPTQLRRHPHGPGGSSRRTCRSARTHQGVRGHRVGVPRPKALRAGAAVRVQQPSGRARLIHKSLLECNYLQAMEATSIRAISSSFTRSW